jgi:hypothetical protein
MSRQGLQKLRSRKHRYKDKAKEIILHIQKNAWEASEQRHIQRQCTTNNVPALCPSVILKQVKERPLAESSSLHSNLQKSHPVT